MIPGAVVLVPGPRTIDFYANSTRDPSGFGEGQVYLGSTTVSVNGTVEFSVSLPVGVAPGSFITATATDQFQQTSEFSRGVPVLADSDGDGVLDAVEDAGPNGGDANGDGAVDRLQNEIASLPNAADGQYVVCEVAAGSVLRNVRTRKPLAV